MTSARGNRYYTPAAYAAAKAPGNDPCPREIEKDAAGTVEERNVTVTRYVESDTALVDRVLKEAGGRQNILVINDEAHHAYRIPPRVDEHEDDQTVKTKTRKRKRGQSQGSNHLDRRPRQDRQQRGINHVHRP